MRALLCVCASADACVYASASVRTFVRACVGAVPVFAHACAQKP